MLRRALSSSLARCLGLLASAALRRHPGSLPPTPRRSTRRSRPASRSRPRDEYQGKVRVETVPFKVVEAGSLKLPSGRICAADPFVAITDAKPFKQATPAGAFPVRLAVARLSVGRYCRVAFARVDFKQSADRALVDGGDRGARRRDAQEGRDLRLRRRCRNGLVLRSCSPARRLPSCSRPTRTPGRAGRPRAKPTGRRLIGPYSFLLDLPLGESQRHHVPQRLGRRVLCLVVRLRRGRRAVAAL